MKSLRIFEGHHVRYAVLAVTLVFAAVAPAFASAEQLTERSVALSSSSKAAAGVSYEIGFSATHAEGAAIVQFCTNSPLVGDFCDAPGGFSATSVGAGTGVTTASAVNANTVKLVATISAGTNTLEMTNITNPAAAGTVYARILTYANGTAADSYAVDDDSSVLGSPVDQGSAAIAITDTIGVSGSVRESLVFCVSKSAITDCSSGLVTPTLDIGEEIGSTGSYALDANNLSTADVFTQISTNALSGAVVSLKSTAGTGGCAGLALYGTGACNIAAAGTTGSFAAGDGKFGVKLTLPTGSAQNGYIAADPAYSTSDYRLDGTAGTGVTGTYGDALFNTSGGYANQLNTQLTFGATAAPNTPAGKYSADLSLVATGTF